ncbi:MAG: DUF1971 domain-containing protein [Pseudomonadales bacterium]|nr:DUF1971 domain-containing protein [Pseudomonadales bacterium]
MKTLPEHVKGYKKTPVFTQDSIPRGLLKDHNTAENVWGVIHILDGELEYHITEGDRQTVILTSEHHGIIEPTVKHHIKASGPVSFYVEFCK